MTPTRREPAPTRREPSLDGLRGLAVLLVYIDHYGGGLKSSHAAVRAFGYVTEACWVGVAVFFALSGFLITGSLWDSIGERHWLRNFYARRALRIFPLYYVVLLGSLLAAIVAGTYAANLLGFVIPALFLQDMPVLAAITDNLAGPAKLYHLWTLAIEEHFYLLWPLLLLAARTRRRALQMCLAVVVLSAAFHVYVFSIAVPHPSLALDVFPLTQFGTLALGAWLALMLRGDAWHTVQRYAAAILALGLIGFLAVSYAAGTAVQSTRLQLAFGLFFVSLAAAATIPLAMRNSPFRSILSIAPLRFLGTVSYGFYLFHIVFETAFDHLASHLTHATDGQSFQAARFVLAFPITLALAWLSYRFLELPFLRLKRRFPAEPTLPA